MSGLMDFEGLLTFQALRPGDLCEVDGLVFI
jgi:hypothetical protein